MKNKTAISAILLLFLSVTVVVFPLLGSRFIPTHDGEFHFIRFAEFYRMVSSGHLFPRWAPTLNSGYGLPLFNFLYPLPNYAGVFLHAFGFGFVRSFFLSLALAYALAVAFSFLWLRTKFKLWPAVFGTLLSSWVPYWFVDIYVRGSAGEVWAFAFMFLALYAVCAGRGTLLAVSVGLLIISHNIMTMLFLPFIAGYALIDNRKMFSWFIPGILLASYFWIPALFEKQYMTGLNTVTYSDHFVDLSELLIPSWGTGLSGVAGTGTRTSYQIGIAPLAVLFLAIIFSFFRKGFGNRKTVYFLAWALGVCFLMLPVGTLFWKLLPPLQYAQYPWRLLSFMIPITAFLAARLSSVAKNKAFLAFPILAAFLLVQGYTRPVTYDPRDDTHYLSNPQFTDGTSSMGESLSTVWNPRFIKRTPVTLTADGNKADITQLTHDYIDRVYAVRTNSVTGLTAHIQYYPGWQVYQDSKPIPSTHEGGAIRFSLPQGSHIVRIRFEETPLRAVSDIISIGTVIFLVAHLAGRGTISVGTSARKTGR